MNLQRRGDGLHVDPRLLTQPKIVSLYEPVFHVPLMEKIFRGFVTPRPHAMVVSASTNTNLRIVLLAISDEWNEPGAFACSLPRGPGDVLQQHGRECSEEGRTTPRTGERDAR